MDRPKCPTLRMDNDDNGSNDDGEERNGKEK